VAIRAAKLLMQAAENARRIEEATDAIERTLFLEAKWAPSALDSRRAPGETVSQSRLGIRLTVRFLRRHDHGQGHALSFGGVAETFVARNRGPRVQAMEIWSGWPALLWGTA
jgi:hypothetical protein